MAPSKLFVPIAVLLLLVCVKSYAADYQIEDSPSVPDVTVVSPSFDSYPAMVMPPSGPLTNDYQIPFDYQTVVGVYTPENTINPYVPLTSGFNPNLPQNSLDPVFNPALSGFATNPFFPDQSLNNPDYLNSLNSLSANSLSSGLPPTGLLDKLQMDEELRKANEMASPKIDDSQNNIAADIN
ncbi:MAG: hypothetical protein NT060_05470 [Candidatus Omnitrophica bacterium]|nr:hypothetical protein [Candidatus Omnitrophota bacterium]